MTACCPWYYPPWTCGAHGPMNACCPWYYMSWTCGAHGPMTACCPWYYTSWTCGAHGPMNACCPWYFIRPHKSIPRRIKSTVASRPVSRPGHSLTLGPRGTRAPHAMGPHTPWAPGYTGPTRHGPRGTRAPHAMIGPHTPWGPRSFGVQHTLGPHKPWDPHVMAGVPGPPT